MAYWYLPDYTTESTVSINEKRTFTSVTVICDLTYIFELDLG